MERYHPLSCQFHEAFRYIRSLNDNLKYMCFLSSQMGIFWISTRVTIAVKWAFSSKGTWILSSPSDQENKQSHEHQMGILRQSDRGISDCFEGHVNPHWNLSTRSVISSSNHQCRVVFGLIALYAREISAMSKECCRPFSHLIAIWLTQEAGW